MLKVTYEGATVVMEGLGKIIGPFAVEYFRYLGSPTNGSLEFAKISNHTVRYEMLDKMPKFAQVADAGSMSKAPHQRLTVF